MRPGISTRTVLYVLGAAAGLGVVWAALQLGGRGAPPPAEMAAARAPEPEPEIPPLRYAEEYPPIDYTAPRPDSDIAALERRIADGSLVLGKRSARDDLLQVLSALDIDPASQALVFSKTSQSVRNISARTPRAIYFNDDHYVAYVHDRPFEIASMDPDVGAVFYTLDRIPAEGTGVQRQTRCLSCHDSYSLTGGGVPRLIIGSGYTDAAGRLVAHEGWILTDDRTPLSSRWGGWYVTGFHGDQVHLGNIVVPDAKSLEHLDAMRKGNIADLDGLLDTSPYPTDTSDIVALMVLAHQIHVQNVITRIHYDVATEMARRESGSGELEPDLDAFVADAAEPLVRALLFDGEAELTAPIEGTSGFAASFEKRGPFDGRGRSLRELELVDRMFEYPVSYVIYSEAFDALPGVVKERVYSRLADLLGGPLPEEPIGHLGEADRSAALEILESTKPEFAAALGH